MKLRHIIPAILCVASVTACADDKFDFPIPAPSFVDISQEGPAKVEVIQREGKWVMTVNGSDFFVKGGAGNNYTGRLADYGGNVFRTYGVAEKTRAILDEAYNAGIYVNFGLYLKRETDGFDYTDQAKVAAQFEEMKGNVKRFKDHPAILCWSVGNETEASYTKKEQLWTAVEQIAAMIKQEDPNHPTTLSLASSNVDHINYIRTLCPSIDILSVNTYAPNLPTVRANLTSGGWTKPYMITEYGPRGTWQMNPEPSRILWGKYLVEQTSTQKAADYLSCYQNHILANKDNGCLGSFVFLWGYQTHGEVLNWYGLFDKKGNTYAAVDEMQYCWTGSYPENRAPVIASRDDMRLNGKKAEESVVLTKNTTGHTATVTASDPDEDPLTYEWYIMQEATKSTDGSMPAGITGLITNGDKAVATIKAPATAGYYRLYVFVRDDHGKVASACIPFKVE